MIVDTEKENICVNKDFLLASIFIPTFGWISAWPFTTAPFFTSGLFSICPIVPISFCAVSKLKSVSASKVIIFFISGIFSSSIVFIIKSAFLFFNKYSLNCVNKPLLRSHPKYAFSFSFHLLFLYKK